MVNVRLSAVQCGALNLLIQVPRLSDWVTKDKPASAPFLKFPLSLDT